MEWIRFAVSAVLICLGLFAFAIGTVGVNFFDFVLNRMHASGICDTLGTLLMILGLVVANGANFFSLKLLLVLLLLWISSPVSTHLLSMVEKHTSNSLGRYIRRKEDRDGSV